MTVFFGSMEEALEIRSANLQCFPFTPHQLMLSFRIRRLADEESPSLLASYYSFRILIKLNLNTSFYLLLYAPLCLPCLPAGGSVALCVTKIRTYIQLVPIYRESITVAFDPARRDAQASQRVINLCVIRS